jgi:hypothetical protein
LAPLEDVDQHFLVTLSRAGAAEPSVRLVFLAPVTAGSEPSLSEVLWWLAGDAWVLRRGNGELGAWAAVYGYPATEEATIWLFEQATRQAAALAALLGDSDVQRLLAIYEAEVGPPGRR